MDRLIYVSEQHRSKILDVKDHLRLNLNGSEYPQRFKQRNDTEFCYRLFFHEDQLKIDTNYYIGVGWIINDKVSIYIEPKLNDSKEVNFLSMLIKSLEAPENFEHLGDLFDIDYDGKWIPIPQNKDLLSPILIVQFLKLVQHIVKKGLKKSYYAVSENLHSKIKGKVLVGRQIKENVFKNRLTKTVCQFQEFGYNFEENQFLKTVIGFVKSYVYQSRTYFSDDQKANLIEILNFCEPAFRSIDEIKNKHLDIRVKRNIFYHDYYEAIRIGKLILKRFSYNITKASERSTSTPPFWLDMSKLFELYIFGKLKKMFPEPNAVTYHDHFKGGKETDILIRKENYQAVVDCKYKPQYKDNDPSLEDKRQLAGYTRLKSVYNKLNKQPHEVIKGLIIYSNQSFNTNFVKDDLFTTNIDEYIDFYKLGVGLPEIL